MVTDVVMPNMSGITLAEHMTVAFPGIGVVLLSGHTADTLDLARLTARGAIYVGKPVTTSVLLEAIERAKAGEHGPLA
jgi:FixJ family two-component response regulator